MPLTFTFVPEEKLVSFRAEEPLRPLEAVETISQLAAMGLGEDTNVFVNARGVSQTPERGDEASMIILRLLRVNGVRRVAVFVESDEVAGTLEKVSAQLVPEGLSLGVFRAAEPAMEWLRQS